MKSTQLEIIYQMLELVTSQLRADIWAKLRKDTGIYLRDNLQPKIKHSIKNQLHHDIYWKIWGVK